jgi:hypothetical protein
MRMDGHNQQRFVAIHVADEGMMRCADAIFLQRLNVCGGPIAAGYKCG